MTIGSSLFIIAVGAILRYAVKDSISGVDLATAGLILMLVGALGLVLGLYFTFVRRDGDVVEEVRVRDRYSA
jgi:Domain of unknown function (DUF6458)